MGQLLIYILYGAVSGFSQYTPVSASAHQALFPVLFKFDSYRPLLSLMTHGGALGALLLLYWKRINHLYQQMRLISSPPRRRKLPPDVEAVWDGKLILTAAVPAMIGGFLSFIVGKTEIGLLPLALLLIGGGTAIYVTDYVPGGNRKARLMSPLEGFLLGVCAGSSVICGISAVGLMLAVGLLRKCERSYILDIALMIVGVMLSAMMVTDLVMILLSGFAGFSAQYLLGCLLAAAAAFGGGIGAILTMRFLAVKTGFSGFGFYSWGFGLVSFILYLMV